MGWENWGWHWTPFSPGYQQFISFHCSTTCCQPEPHERFHYVDITEFGTDKQTDGQTDSGVCRVALQVKHRQRAVPNLVCHLLPGKI